MEKEKFNQAKYMREWQKENMKQVKASYKTEFVDEFKEACKSNHFHIVFFTYDDFNSE